MAKFKQKIFFWGAVANAGLQVATSVVPTLLGNSQEKKNIEAQQQMQKNQLFAQKRENQKMMNTLKSVARSNPIVAGQAAGQMMGTMQQQFSLTGVIDTVADVAKTGIKMGAHKKIARGLAAGATAAGAGYLVDKAIQRRAKKDGIDLGREDGEYRKKSLKGLSLAALAAGATAAGAYGAKKGYLGKTLGTAANKYLTKRNLGRVGKTMKNAITDQFVDRDKFKAAKTAKDKFGAINKLNIGFTLGAAAMPAVGYAISRRALKQQAEQSEGNYNERHYSDPNANFLTKGLRHVKALGKSVYRTVRNDMRAEDAKHAPVRYALSKISSFQGGGGMKGVNNFVSALGEQGKKSGNAGTQKVVDFLGKHKKLALGGSIAAAAAIGKATGIGNKIVNKVTGAVDRNALRYNRSLSRPVQEDYDEN